MLHVLNHDASQSNVTNQRVTMVCFSLDLGHSIHPFKYTKYTGGYLRNTTHIVGSCTYKWVGIQPSCIG